MNIRTYGETGKTEHTVHTALFLGVYGVTAFTGIAAIPVYTYYHPRTLVNIDE